MSRPWLVISYLANLDGNAQSHCIDDRISWLVDLGVQVFLLSGPCGLRHSALTHWRVPSVAPTGIKLELDFVLRRMEWHPRGVQLMRALTMWLLRPICWIERVLLPLGGESAWSWALTGTIAGLLLSVRQRPAVVYSTGGPASAHVIAAIIASLLKVPWIAELQDPLVYSNAVQSDVSKRLSVYLERIIFERALKVVFYTEAAKERAEARHGRGKGIVIYPGTSLPIIPASHPSASPSPRRCTFVYIGSLYQTRNLDTFLDALRELFSRQPAIAGEMALDVLGEIHTAGIRDRIEGFAFPVVRYHGMVSRARALQAAAGADVLLLVQNTDARSQETIPTKVFEYLLVGKPILGLVYRNVELRTLLERYGHTAVEADDVPGIAAAVQQLVTEWRIGTLGGDVGKYGYTARDAATRLLEEVLG